MANHLDTLEEEIKEKEIKLSEINTQLEIVEQTIQKQTSEFNTQYQSSEKSRSEKFEMEVSNYSLRSEENIKSYSNKSDEEFKSLSTKASKIIEVLTKLQDDASRVYGVTINTLQGGAYSSYANEERQIANRYHIYASGLMLIGVAFLIAPEMLMFLEEKPYTFELIKVLGRMPISLIVFVPAFYYARESGKHRSNEVTNRRRHHILTTLDPYIELMENDKAEELRVHVAKTIFSEVSVNQSTNDRDCK